MLLTTVPPPALTVVIVFQFSLTGESLYKTQQLYNSISISIACPVWAKYIRIPKCVIKSFSRKDQSFPQNLSQSALFKLNEGKNCFSHWDKTDPGPGWSLQSLVLGSLGEPRQPRFEGEVKNVTVKLGQEAVLSCSVISKGDFKVGWIKVRAGRAGSSPAASWSWWWRWWWSWWC